MTVSKVRRHNSTQNPNRTVRKLVKDLPSKIHGCHILGNGKQKSNTSINIKFSLKFESANSHFMFKKIYKFAVSDNFNSPVIESTKL